MCLSARWVSNIRSQDPLAVIRGGKERVGNRKGREWKDVKG